ncbi:MAG: hypothetical protein JST75_00645 [Bacteroidetes bacterium]|nr:hypothetical protein [Bacteroidota bacterium]
MKMNIDRNNYEEFFLLYADNELSAAEKQLVESFVKENADLQEEFSLLAQSKLVADNNIVFENKESLMRSSLDTSSLINHSNYEEFFLLYLDNELNEDDQKAVEKFADKYPSLWYDMMMLQKARVEPDSSIIFVGKEKLYRKERKKVFLLPWQRIAAAAILLILVGFFVFKYATTKSNHNEVVVIDKKSVDEVVKKSDTDVTSKLLDTLNNTNTAKEEEQLRVDRKENSTQKSTPNKRDVAIKNPKQEKEPMEQPNDILPVAVENKNIDKISSINTDNISVLTDATANIAELKTVDPTKNQASEQQIKPASFNDQANLPEEPNGFLAFSTKKNKMRGIFRRVSRVFEKTTNVEGDKSSVLIGNFQIAVK